MRKKKRKGGEMGREGKGAEGRERKI